MGRIQVDVRVAGAQRFHDLAQRLQQAARGDLQRKLVDAVQEEGRPALDAVRRAWLGVDVTSSRGGGRKSTGLRARVAAATQIRTQSTGISVTVEGGQVDPRYGDTLARGLDGQGSWRHPVYGNRNVWRSQRGQEVFYRTLGDHESRFRLAVQRAMDDIARQLEG